MPISEPTVDELIPMFNRSSLPIIAVEGETDENVIRMLEEKVGIPGIIVPVGGRGNLFSLIRRLADIKNPSVVFLADQDMYCIEGGHFTNDRLVYTWGYSIENDIIAGSRINKLIWPNERSQFEMIKSLAIKYFAWEYEAAKRQGRSPVWKVALPTIIDPAKLRYLPTVKESEAIAALETKLSRKMHRNYRKLVRGKQLLQIYMFILNRKGRKSRFTNGALLDSCISLGPNRRLFSLADSLRTKVEGLPDPSP